MSQAAVQHDQGQYGSPRAAYNNLTEVIAEVAVDLEQNNEATYSVVWKTTNHDYGSEYRVIDTKPLALEETLIIEGQSRGGKYQVVPRGSGPAVVRHLRKDGTISWEEEAIELIIMQGQFKWEPEKGVTIIDKIRERLPR
ncbi:hypothetical protein SAMN04488066_11588 [Halorubrum aquaticum]|uniref:Uncharacterized protein n=1 Tax=Halorubrum aquaticum TaxID=387340 RepID=A0A1I3BUY7_9EURY|nr:hypothetical protein [Halorubrum aquaticum]SFH66097.1 hypothetical protein SAMN04488066_11588 [Halorubrum aquaticum]